MAVVIRGGSCLGVGGEHEREHQGSADVAETRAKPRPMNHSRANPREHQQFPSFENISSS
jgi:hypothetical protein